MKSLTRYFFLRTIPLIMVGCWDQRPSAPLVTQIGGTWKWTKTMDRRYNVLESSSSAKSGHIDVKILPYGSEFCEVLDFYVDSIKVDSLFMPATDNYNSSIQKDNQVVVNYLDKNRNPVAARFKFFFPRNKSSASRMELTIQKNTLNYNPEMDSLIKEYVPVIK
ncbi:hypothetical protein SAMN04487996_110192 [Dyadobacter soli]|uniref:Uncharacterized protein n=1 Tax=Dyadobacter soli TaxID=659014 RepID=A0A1G7KQR9_9BACT|nr:hypothetical protein [Dyadobacter soli]SDF39572.1 hypothetical protein SAMN04487996_110192 [Dyadobacter soli]